MVVWAGALLSAGLATTTASAAPALPTEAITLVARGIMWPGAIAAGPDGNLWFTNVNNAIGRVTPGGVVSSFGAPGIQFPNGITSGPDGNLWFTNEGNGSIGRITPAGVVSTFGAAGVSSPRAITAGPDGNLWFMASGRIGRSTPGGIITTFPGSFLTGRMDITAGPDGNLWFTTEEHDEIGRITPSGIITRFGGAGINGARGITTGPDGNLWFANAEDSIGRITPSGVVSRFLTPGVAHAADITSGPDGNLWFTGQLNDSIGRITTAGVVSTFGGLGINRPYGITTGADGNLWFTNANDSIGRITTAGSVSRVTEPGLNYPSGIVAGPDGNLWSPNLFGDSISRVTPSGMVSTFTDPGIDEPSGITAGPDGNLWFTSRANASVGRITTSGAVTMFTDPRIVNPQRITSGPDGNLWFTGDGWIGRITPAGQIVTFTDPGISLAAGIVTGADGNLWFTNSGSIGRITPAGVVTTFPAGGVTVAIAAGADGNLWFTGDGSIGRITVAGVITTFTDSDIHYAEAIAAGPDGNLWFANNTRAPAEEMHSVGRITPAGVVSTFNGTDISLTGVTAGPGGAMWFASRGDAIGFVTPGLAGAPGAVSATGRSGEATVAWTAPADNGGSPITGYTVTAVPGGQTCTWSSGPLSCTVTGLSSATHTFTVAALTANGAGGASVASSPVFIPAGVALHPLSPRRILDSRPAGPQVGPYGTAWGQGDVRDVTVAGFGVDPVPTTAEAVVLNVTVTSTTTPGYLTIWPAGQARPLASNLNWAAGQTVANAVTVKVGAGGKMSIFNPVGSAHVIVDLVGWYDAAPGGDGYTTLTPARILDSRPAGPQVGPYGTPWGPDQTREVTVAGVGGVAADADAVVVNVTVTGTTAAGYLTIWPAGYSQPVASSLNWAAGQTVANAVTVKVANGGNISVRNAVGSAHVVFDVVGSFAPLTGSLFHPLAPARIQDSRVAGPQVGPYATPWGTGTTRPVQVTGNGGVPAGAAAALLNLTVTGTSAFSYLTVAPAGEAPLASSLNWLASQTVSNAVTTKLSPAGAISVRNANGTAHVIADMAGWYG